MSPLIPSPPKLSLQALFNLERQANELGVLRRAPGQAGVSAAAPTPAAAAASAAAAGRPSAAFPALDGSSGAGAAAVPMPPPRFSGDPHGASAGVPRRWDEQLAAANFSSGAGGPSATPGSRSASSGPGVGGYASSNGGSGFAGRAEEDARFDVAAGRFDDADDGRFTLPADHRDDAAFRAGAPSSATSPAGRPARAARDRAGGHSSPAAGASAGGRVRAADGGVIVHADGNPVLSELFGWSGSSGASAGSSPVSAASPASNGSSPASRHDGSGHHHHHHHDHEPGMPSYEARRRHRDELARRRGE